MAEPGATVETSSLVNGRIEVDTTHEGALRTLQKIGKEVFNVSSQHWIEDKHGKREQGCKISSDRGHVYIEIWSGSGRSGSRHYEGMFIFYICV